MFNTLISTLGYCAVRARAKYFGQGGSCHMMDKVKEGTVAESIKALQPRELKESPTHRQCQMTEKFAFLFLLTEHNPTFIERHCGIFIPLT
jgi:hypothetical protein